MIRFQAPRLATWKPSVMPFTLTKQTDIRNAWFIWLGFAIGVILFAWMEGFSHTVTGAYRFGADNWLAGKPLYRIDDYLSFLYPPTSAMIFAPYSMLPHELGEILWRVTCMGVLALGVRSASAAATRACGVEFFPLVTLLTLAALLPAARNGQATLLIAGMMLGAIGAATARRWWVVGFLLALATVIKPLAIVLMLLLGVLRPRVIVPAIVFMVLLLALPALHDGFQKAGSDLVDWVAKMRTASAPGAEFRVSDLFGGLVAFGIDVPTGIAYLVRALAAVATLVLCAISFARFGHVRGVLLAGAFGFTYFLLFNPRTENNGYGALAPAEAILASWLLLFQGRMILGVVVASLPFIALSGYEIGKFITPGRETWMAPLSAVVFLIVLCLLLFEVGSKPSGRPIRA